MIREAIDKILELGAIQIFDMEDGRKFSSRPISPIARPRAQGISTVTLTGLADYLRHNIDDPAIPLGKIFILVQNPNTVCLVDHVDEANLDRQHWCRAEHHPDKVPFGSFSPIEDMIILLKTHFQESEDLFRAIALLGNIKDEKVVVTADDGFTQTVTARAGIAMVKDVNVPNPLTLSPNRTFREIDQPASPFLLRLRSSGGGGLPTAALFETDGGAWQLVAMDSIKNYLENSLKAYGLDVPIIM